MSYSKNNDRVRMDQTNADRNDERTQGRAVLTRLFGVGKNNSIVFGSEFHAIRVGNIYGEYDVRLKDNYSAVFTESEFYVSPKLAARVGLRGEYTSVIDEFNVAPRLSLAYKVGKFPNFEGSGFGFQPAV